MMKMDFHTHGKLAKKLPFSTAYTDWLMNQAKQAGLDAIALTEHFNTLQFDEVYAYLKGKAVLDGDTLLMPNGLRIFCGMETDIAQGGHILCIGRYEDILTLNQKLAPYKQPNHFIDFDALMDLFDQYDVIVGAAHPYRSGSHIPELTLKQLSRFDFVDLNGKDMGSDRNHLEPLTFALAQKIDRPLVCGSDTHQAVQYGCVYTEFNTTINTVEGLRQVMNKGDYSRFIDNHVSQQVQAAAYLKASLKTIHALGGDYVAVLLGKDDGISFADKIATKYRSVVVDCGDDDMVKTMDNQANAMALTGYQLISTTMINDRQLVMVFVHHGV